jgi:hypothetical protein
MTYKGHVKNGVIVLDEPSDLPDGTQVEVLPVRSEQSETSEGPPPPTVAERYRRFIGKAEGLPPDYSVNLDHYLYGMPKRQ